MTLFFGIFFLLYFLKLSAGQGFFFKHAQLLYFSLSETERINSAEEHPEREGWSVFPH